MVEVFLRTLPFFAVIGLGYWAGRSGFISAAATAGLTKFIFFFPLSALIFRFAANLSLGEIINPTLFKAYALGTAVAFSVAMLVALWRRQSGPNIAIEGQCTIIGNTGFLGIPMMVILFGEDSIGTMMLILAIDMAIFSTFTVLLINLGRGQTMTSATIWHAFKGVLTNPMILSIVAGLLWSASTLTVPKPVNEFLAILAGAATPGALFAIGASLAAKTTERFQVAAWLSFGKLALHPTCVAICALWLFPVAPYAAKIAITSAALPVAGSVYMLAQHYDVAPQRASAAIFISTVASIVTLPTVIAWLSSF